MTDVPYFKKHETGPIFLDENSALADDTETFLRSSDRDVRDAIAKENTRDTTEASFKQWLSENLKDLDLDIE